MNRVTLIGYLAADPDIRELSGGGRTASFSIETVETWIDKASGEPRELIERSRVTILSESLVHFAERRLHKGSVIRVDGSLQTRQWVDQQNVERYSTEVVVLPVAGKLKLLEGLPEPTRPTMRTRGAELIQSSP